MSQDQTPPVKRGRGRPRTKTPDGKRPRKYRSATRFIPLHNRDEYRALDVDTTMVRRYLSFYFHQPIGKLRELAERNDIPFGEASIISVMIRIFDTGDVYALNALYDRMIGPILRKIEVTGEVPFEDWSLEKLMEEKLRLAALNKDTIEMIHKEQKLRELVEAGTLKPGEFTGEIPKQIEAAKEEGGTTENTPHYVAAPIKKTSGD